jgi:uncharacterized membrane protein YdfJ with MMPL/SSD domain
MQGAMHKLGRFLERRRWLVVGVWLAILLASAPFAMRQTEHLTSGGFVVPGSGSQAVDRSLHEFDRDQRDSLAVVLAQRSGSTPAGVRAAVDRVGRAADRLEHAQLSLAVAAKAKREAGKAPIVVVPLDVRGTQNQLSDLAVDMRKEVGAGA